MCTLTIYNSICKLIGFTIEDFLKIKELLSYRVETRGRFGSVSSKKKYLIDRYGTFPTGLLYLIDSYIASNTHIKVSRIDKRQRPATPTANNRLFTLKLPFKPYEEQVTAVSVTNTKERGCYSMVTGFGKSVTMALLVNKLQVKTLIIVPNLELKKQLTKSFKDFFGTLDNITIENIDSGKLNKANDYKCLIIDEAHHSASSTYRKLNLKAWNNIYYRYFFTATPFRSKDEEQLLYESIAGQVIYEVPYRLAVDKGYIVPVEAYFYNLPKVKCKGKKWPEVYSELVVHRKDRNELIAKLVNNLHRAGKSTLVLVKHIEHGLLIQEELEKLGLTIPFVKGENDNNREMIIEFIIGDSKTLIGTGVIGEGTDTKPAEYVIVAGLGKSKNQFLQNCGRGVRTYPGKDSAKIILFRDLSHKYTSNHFLEQFKYCEQVYGVTPAVLD